MRRGLVDLGGIGSSMQTVGRFGEGNEDRPDRIVRARRQLQLFLVVTLKEVLGIIVVDRIISDAPDLVGTGW